MSRNVSLSAAQCVAAVFLLAGCGQSGQDLPAGEEADVVTMNASAPPAQTGSENSTSATDSRFVPVDPAENTAEASPTPEPAELPAAKPQSDKAASKTPVPSVAAAAAVERPASFAMCAVCHSTGKGEPHKIGPNLFGVVGSGAGTKPGYAYSDAMKKSQITWTESELRTFIANPTAHVPGTKMVMAGPKDEAARQAIVDYLSSLK